MTARRRLPVLLAAAAALLALPAPAQAAEPRLCMLPDEEWQMLVPREGEPHFLDVSCTEDPDGHDIVSFEWDFDGDGTYDQNTGSLPFAIHVFEGRGDHLDATVNLGVRATDSAGESKEGHVALRIRDAINSWFLFSPQIVNPGDRIDLKANATPDTVGAVLTHDWDLDGDGTFEHATGTTASTWFTAPETVGKHTIRLRITDESGEQSIVKREIEVAPRHPSRDQQPWLAPANLGNTPVLEIQARELDPNAAATVAPVGPEAPPVQNDPGADQIRVWRPKLRRMAANRNGLTLEYTGGLKWKRYTVVVRLPADRAATYGLPRRTIVLARGAFRFNGEGVGKVKMRWTKGAYKIFRRVRNGVMDIIAKPVDARR